MTRQRASEAHEAFARVGTAAAPPEDGEAAPAAGGLAPPAGLDAETLGRWRWQLGATSRKAAAAQSRAEAARAAWTRLVADAEAAGVPARLIVAAAADAGIDLPGSG